MGRARTEKAAEIDAHVGRRLRRAREERGLSLAALAALIGHKSGQAVLKYEQGEAMPAARMLITAHALGLEIGWFFEGLVAPTGGVAEEPAAFDAELADSTQSRKIARLLRRAPQAQHAVILRVVRALVEGEAPGGD